MPNFKKSSTGKPVKKSTTTKGAGSRSPGHRGYRPDATPVKKRWTASDRATRTGDRSASTDRRPDWTPPTERPAYGDRKQRTERPPYGDRTQRSDRPAYGDRTRRTERPAYGDREQRTERPSYGDRIRRDERPTYGERSARPERKTYENRPDRKTYQERSERSERPKYDDRAPRTEQRGYGDRPGRPERPARRDRPARAKQSAYNDRASRTERPSYGERSRTDRPVERRPRTEHSSYTDRPARTERSNYGQRRESDFYPPRRDAVRAGDRPSAGSQPHDDVVLERLEAQVLTAGEADGMTFHDLGVGDNICRQLAGMGAETPFPIQVATIPDVLAGKDVLGRGKTGSGKTIAFGVPLVERLMENNGGKNRKIGRKPRALILAPTRELAMQIDRTVQPIARSVGLFTATIVGGVPQYRQVSALQRGVDIVIATPGRVEDLIEQGRLDLGEVFVTVIDEADHMCDLGFLEPVERILHQTREGGQKLLFSATLDRAVAKLVKDHLVDPAVHEVAGEDQASSTIDHRVLLIEHRDKRAIIEQLASGEGKTLIFARTRAFAEELADYLDDAGIRATSLHGDLNQSRRTRNLQLLISGRVKVLVATDVAARGIHVDDVSLVIQADAPDEYKTYLHRAGRTGRAGKAGTVVTLVPRSRRRRMDELLGRADITASVQQVSPGDVVLEELAAL